MISIIHYCTKGYPFNGNIFYNFEYFIYLIKHNIDVELHIVSEGPPLSLILDVMEDRYNLKDVEYKDRISFSFDKITRRKFGKIISNAKAINMLQDNISADEAHIVHTFDTYNLKLKDSDLSKNFKRYFSYNESKVVEKVNHIKVNHIRTMYLDLLKKPIKSDNAIYLHICGFREISLKEFIRYVLPARNNKHIITSFPESQEKMMNFYNGLEFITGFENHVPDLFSKFDTYFYILLRNMDYSSRMLIESSYFNKDIIFIDKTNNVHGGNQRYNDILNGDIEKYKMSFNDLLLSNIKGN